MQSRVLKIVKLSLFLLVLSTVVNAQSNNSLLVRADSLFQQKRYIQSLELYQKLFEDHRYTPAMLLRMAYVEEGLNNISRSVYYLNLYYLATQDEDALTKLEEVAIKNRLEGYSTDETDTFLSFYLTHHTLITIILVALAVLALAIALTQRLIFKHKPIGEFVCMCIVSVLCLLHLSQKSFWEKAIIAKDNTYVMSGPSAGASVIMIARDGHRVSVIGKQDVWVKVKLGESEGYIRNSNLLPVKL
jgi:tetratricopeptide (TPR) repeat protein